MDYSGTQEMESGYIVRSAKPIEFDEIGQLIVSVFSKVEGFPKPSDQPEYYRQLADMRAFTNRPGVELLVAVHSVHGIGGAVVYFYDMTHYGSGGISTKEKNTSGFRLLAVSPRTRGLGIGKNLAMACINKAIGHQHDQMIIHTTSAMQTAWKIYEGLGFKRSEDLDFMQEALPVLGFRLPLKSI